MHNASADTTRIVNDYCLGIIINFPPEAAKQLLSEDKLGTPQRFLWASAIDPNIPENAPFAMRPRIDLPATTVVVRFDESIRREIRTTLWKRTTGQEEARVADARVVWIRCKVAAVLTLWDGRSTVEWEGWRLAGMVLATSCAVRDNLLEMLATQAREEEEERTRKSIKHTIALRNAINPTDPQNLVAVANNIADLSQLGVWFSTDGGLTWTPNFLDEEDDGFDANDFRFDPNVAFDSDGNVYVVYSTAGTGNRLLLARSTDGGQNFNHVTTVTTDGGSNNLHTAMVTTRSDGGAANADDVLVIWARVQAGGESIEAALSLDAGATFTITNNFINGTLQRTFLPWAAVDGNGDFHVVWEVNQGGRAGVILHATIDGTTLADGTNNQLTTVQITDFAEPTSKIPAQPDRGLFSVVTVDVDRFTGRIFVSYTDRPNTASNDTDIYVRFSDDNGATWSTRTRINDDATTTSQFMPRLAIDQTTAIVGVIWYDARRDPINNQRVDVFASVSNDGGLHWQANRRVTTARSNETTTNAARDAENNYGEYLGLSAYNGVAHAAWTDARTANVNAGTNEDVYTATVLPLDADALQMRHSVASDRFDHLVRRVRDEMHNDGSPLTLLLPRHGSVVGH